MTHRVLIVDDSLTVRMDLHDAFEADGVETILCATGAEPDYPHAGTVAFDTTRRFDADSICRVYSMTKNVTRSPGSVRKVGLRWS